MVNEIIKNLDNSFSEQTYYDSCKELFDAIDKDGDGLIGVNELKNYLRVLGQKATKEEVIKMIEDADGGNKGCLEFEDFLKIVGNPREKNQSEEENIIIDAFEAFGGKPDKTGNVKLNAITDLIEKDFELEINIKKLLEANDYDKSGKVDYEEFKTLLMK